MPTEHFGWHNTVSGDVPTTFPDITDALDAIDTDILTTRNTRTVGIDPCYALYGYNGGDETLVNNAPINLTGLGVWIREQFHGNDGIITVDSNGRFLLSEGLWEVTVEVEIEDAAQSFTECWVETEMQNSSVTPGEGYVRQAHMKKSFGHSNVDFIFLRNQFYIISREGATFDKDEVIQDVDPQDTLYFTVRQGNNTAASITMDEFNTEVQFRFVREL